MADKQILESKFQGRLIKRIKAEFGEDNVIVLKNDPDYIQGFPDLTILGKKDMLCSNAKEAKMLAINLIKISILIRLIDFLMEDLYILKMKMKY